MSSTAGVPPRKASDWTFRAIDANSGSNSILSTESSTKSVGEGARGRSPTSCLEMSEYARVEGRIYAYIKRTAQLRALAG